MGFNALIHKGRRVVFHEKTPGDVLWYPAFEAKVLDETASLVKVRRHWWRRKEWLPKQGPFLRVSKVW